MKWSLLATLFVAAAILFGLLVVREESRSAAIGLEEDASSVGAMPTLLGDGGDETRATPRDAASPMQRNVAAMERAREVSHRRPGSIVVRIVYPDGTPAARAAAWHVEWPLHPPHEWMLVRFEEQRRHRASARSLLGFGRPGEEPLARHLVADDDGCVYPDLRGPTTELDARVERDGLVYRGSLALHEAGDAQPGAQHTVVLARWETFPVRVVDRDGDPIEDMPVAIVADQRDGAALRRRSLATARTDASGRARLEVSPETVDAARARAALRVVAVVCSDPLPSAPLAAGATLVVPPTGTLVVEFTGPLTSLAHLQLSAAEEPAVALRALVIDGRAEFVNVALDTSFEAELSSGRDRLTERIVGPTSSERRVVHRWQSMPPRPAYTFSLRTKSGEPIAHRMVLIAVLHRERSSAPQHIAAVVTTDSEGRGSFFDVHGLAAETELRFLVLAAAPTAGGRRTMSGTARVPTPAQDGGALDLGDVVLDLDARLATGRVIDRDGEPIAHAEVTVSKGGVTVARTLSLDDGTFEVQSHSPGDGPFELRVSARGYMDSGPLPVRADRPVVVALDVASSLRVTLRMPSGLEERVRPHVVLPDGTTRETELADDPEAIREPGVRRHFFRGLAPGPARLVVRSIVSDESIVERDLVVTEGLLDLGTVDVTDLVPWFRLTLRAREGDPPPVYSVRYDGVADPRLHQVHRRPALLPRPLPGRTVTIHAGGFRPATVLVDRADVEVELERGPLAVVRLPAGYPRPPAGTEVSVYFTRRDHGMTPVIQAMFALTDANVYEVGLDAPGVFTAHLDVEYLRTTTVTFELTADALADGTPTEIPFDLREWTNALGRHGR